MQQNVTAKVRAETPSANLLRVIFGLLPLDPRPTSAFSLFDRLRFYLGEMGPEFARDEIARHPSKPTATHREGRFHLAVLGQLKRGKSTLLKMPCSARRSCRLPSCP